MFSELWVADPSMAHAILSRRHDFVQLDIATRKSPTPVYVLSGLI